MRRRFDSVIPKAQPKPPTRKERTAMPTEDNRALVRRYFEAYNQGDLQAIRNLASPDFTCHMGGMPDPVAGLEANLAADAGVRAAFSDLHWSIDDLIAEGDKVVVRRGWSMKHTGPFMGLPASGQTLSGTGIDIIHIRDGRLAEQWTESDNLSFMQQLGALPNAEREPGL
jgi:steroid delta-isomerase-like uncharacterized protein